MLVGHEMEGKGRPKNEGYYYPFPHFVTRYALRPFLPLAFARGTFGHFCHVM